MESSEEPSDPMTLAKLSVPVVGAGEVSGCKDAPLVILTAARWFAACRFNRKRETKMLVTLA